MNQGDANGSIGTIQKEFFNHAYYGTLKMPQSLYASSSGVLFAAYMVRRKTIA